MDTFSIMMVTWLIDSKVSLPCITRWGRDLHDLTLPLFEQQSSISSTLYITYSMLFTSAFFFFFQAFERVLCYYYLVLMYVYIRLGRQDKLNLKPMRYIKVNLVILYKTL